jgi:Mrp family chromosome partitioning ATPase
MSETKLSQTSEFPRAIPRSVWLTARARNAVNRPVFIGAVSASAFVAALVALVLAPQQAHRVAPVSQLVARPDTLAFAAALNQARTRMAGAESSLALVRLRPHTAVSQEADTLGPRLSARRDSLSNILSELDGLMTRAEGAPVAASYRALAESPQLSSNPHAKALLDSLRDVEKDREAFGTSEAADPVYMALSARSGEIGRSIQAVAQERRDALRQQIAKLISPTPRAVVAQAPVADTSSWIAERDSARSMVSQASNALTTARNKAREFDIDRARATRTAGLDASPVALLAAALVFGIALGFGSAFVDEMRRPRVSDEHELERITGTRVLATVKPRPKRPERMRRQSDRNAPPYFDPAADGYQLTYLHVARTGASRLMLTIAGEDTGIASVIAINVAAIAADEARSTILIDTASLTSPVAAALRLHAEPGLADVIGGRAEWTEVTSSATIGRDRIINVLPSGITASALNPSELNELFAREGQRMARHYEATIVVASADSAVRGLPAALPIRDTILCARIGVTRIADVQSALDGIRQSGGHPLGVVLWDAVAPALPAAERIAGAPRPLRTAEMKALTTAR